MSVVDFTAVLGRDVTKEEVNAAFEKASTGELKGIMAYTEEPLVSMDLKGDEHSTIVSAIDTIVLGNMVKVVSWYDNEWGYSCRIADLVAFVGRAPDRRDRRDGGDRPLSLSPAPNRPQPPQPRSRAQSMEKQTVRDFDPQGKRVLVRVDFNVPIEDGKVKDDSRIRAALPTIRYLLEHGASVVLMSHLGRPKGKVVESARLRPVAQRLSALLRMPVPITGDPLGHRHARRRRAAQAGPGADAREPALPLRGGGERRRVRQDAGELRRRLSSTTRSARRTAPTPRPSASPSTCRPTPAC